MLAEYLTRIQVQSDAHPELAGAWFRAFDYDKEEYVNALPFIFFCAVLPLNLRQPLQAHAAELLCERRLGVLLISPFV